MLTPISRIEPPFWYAGMKRSELQILFYGKKTGSFQVTVSNSVEILNVKRTENPNYLFVTINTKNIPASNFTFSFKRKNKTVFTLNYSLKKRRDNSASRQSFDSSDMIYLLMPDRFSEGIPNKDTDKNLVDKFDRNNPGGRHGGDIQGIINHLDYIKELGATTIWSTPLCEDDEEINSYHTYAQSDVYKIDPRYGTNDDYVRLSAEIHNRGMKLIMDYVTNHWGLNHWMIKDLPTHDWIHQFEKYTETNNKRTVVHDIHASKIDITECLDGWFVPSMPDLNQRNPLMLTYLIQNAIWWIEYADLDGFRVDTYNYVEPDSITTWTKSILEEYPNLNIVGEISMRNQAQLSYWQKDSPISAINNFNSFLPSIMDFILSDDLLFLFNEDESTWGRGMTRIYDNFANDFLYPNVNNLMIFAENHDTKRINHNYLNDFRKYKMTMAVLATVRGIPQLYYGSEIGMAGDKDFGGDEAIRQDFPGGWEGDQNNAFTKEGRTDLQNEYFDFTSKLFNWRKTKPVIHFGKMTHYIPEDNIYVYFRYDLNETVMVIFNSGITINTLYTSRFKENIKKFLFGTDILSEVTFDISTEITLEAKSVLILELH